MILDNPIRLRAGGQSVVCQLESQDAGLPTAKLGATGISQFFNAALLRWRSRLPTAFQVPTDPPAVTASRFLGDHQWIFKLQVISGSPLLSLAWCISFPAMRIISFYCQEVKRPFISGGNLFLFQWQLVRTVNSVYLKPVGRTWNGWQQSCHVIFEH